MRLFTFTRMVSTVLLTAAVTALAAGVGAGAAQAAPAISHARPKTDELGVIAVSAAGFGDDRLGEQTFPPAGDQRLTVQVSGVY